MDFQKRPMNRAKGQIHTDAAQVENKSSAAVLVKLLATWRNKLTSGSVNGQIFRALIVVGAVTAGTKSVGFVKEMFCAARFGTGDGLDAFFIAWLMPSFVVNVVSGAVNAAIVPIFVKVRSAQGELAAQKLLSHLSSASLMLMLGLALLLAGTSHFWLRVVASGFGQEKLALTQFLVFVLLPGILFEGVGSVWYSVLNAKKRFAFPSAAPAVIPLCVVLALVFWGDGESVIPLAVGTVCGQCLMTILLGWGLKRQGLKNRLCWPKLNSETRLVTAQFIPLIGASALYSASTLIDQSMAASLSPGSVSALNYGSKVPLVLMAFSSAALGTAVMPYFSQLVASGDSAGIRQTFKFYSKLVVFLSVPATVLLVVFSDVIVGILFQRGAFTDADAVVVARIAAMYSLQMPFYFLGLLGIRLLHASLRNKEVLIINVITNALNILLNYVLMNVMGVAGIALSTSIVYFVCASTVYAVIYFQKFQTNFDSTESIVPKQDVSIPGAQDFGSGPVSSRPDNGRRDQRKDRMLILY
jgi:putative peptidoglycan lipid II flippase